MSCQITGFFHCSRCIKEMPDGVSPMEWSKTQTGLTRLGVQVWCNRHDVNVVHIRFTDDGPVMDTSTKGDFSNGN